MASSLARRREVMMLVYVRLELGSLGRALDARQDLLRENLALRQQLAIRDRDRLFWTLLSARCVGWREALMVVQPAMVVRWRCAGWRRCWSWKSRSFGRGWRCTLVEARQLIARLSGENPLWGAARVRGRLRALG